MEFERVKVDVHGRVGVLTLNHPEVMNAVSPEMLKGLMGALAYIEKPETGLRALVMTGVGRGFCAGANLGGGAGSNDFGARERDAGAALETAYHPFLRRLRNLKMPFVTAVNGAAAGVGMSFAMMGDMILASKSAYFLQAFRRWRFGYFCKHSCCSRSTTTARRIDYGTPQPYNHYVVAGCTDPQRLPADPFFVATSAGADG